MFHKLLLAVAIVGASFVAMSPSDADARWGARRYYNNPRRASFGPRYAPRSYAPNYSVYRGRTYGPYGYRGYGYGYGRSGVSFGPRGVYVGW